LVCVSETARSENADIEFAPSFLSLAMNVELNELKKHDEEQREVAAAASSTRKVRSEI
jgi:hypothetical protein